MLKANADARRRAATVQFTVDAQKRLVNVRIAHRVTAADFERLARDLRSHPEFKDDFSEVADFTEMDDIDLQAEEMLKLADRIDPFSGQARRAFVVRTKSQRYLARMHRTLHPANIQIFESIEEAQRWINL
ncbi:MAG: STAS/SEC14 domain-containing protein [Candidatus Sulfotelmatobacter sp.]|jgi:hypothetical protein